MSSLRPADSFLVLEKSSQVRGGTPRARATVEALVNRRAPQPELGVTAAQKLPFFVIDHGDNDCLVPWGQSQELHDALDAAGAKDGLTILQGYAHDAPGFEQPQTQPCKDLLDTALCR